MASATFWSTASSRRRPIAGSPPSDSRCVIFNSRRISSAIGPRVLSLASGQFRKMCFPELKRPSYCSFFRVLLQHLPHSDEVSPATPCFGKVRASATSSFCPASAQLDLVVRLSAADCSSGPPAPQAPPGRAVSHALPVPAGIANARPGCTAARSATGHRVPRVDLRSRIGQRLARHRAGGRPLYPRR